MKEEMKNNIDASINLDGAVDTKETATEISVESVEESYEPSVIRINDVLYERVTKTYEEDESEEKIRVINQIFKRPNDKNLQKYALVSFIFGVLSCSLFAGHLIFPFIGIMFGAIAIKNKYKSIYSAVGFWSSIVGAILGVIIHIVALVVAVLLVVAMFIFTPIGGYLTEIINTILSMVF